MLVALPGEDNEARRELALRASPNNSARQAAAASQDLAIPNSAAKLTIHAMDSRPECFQHIFFFYLFRFLFVTLFIEPTTTSELHFWLLTLMRDIVLDALNAFLYYCHEMGDRTARERENGTRGIFNFVPIHLALFGS